MTYSSIALLALLVHIIINHDVIRNKHYRHESAPSTAFRRLILSIAAFYVTDAFWGILYDAHLITAVFIDTMVYFVAMAFTVFFWSQYVIRYLNEKNTYLSVLSVVGWIFLVAVIAVQVLNIFWPVMFWFDEEGAYHAGNLRYAALATQVLMFLGSSIYVLVRLGTRTAGVRRRHIAIGVFGVTMNVMVILQVLFPLQPMYSMGCLLGACILHSFVLGDIMEDRRRELEEHIRKEKEQRLELGSARYMAYTDQLTGVKNTQVYRIGGDEFVAVKAGEDHENRKILLAEFDTQMEENQKRGGVVIATGLAVYRPGHDHSYRRIFERADQRMYDRKGTLKSMEE